MEDSFMLRRQDAIVCSILTQTFVGNARSQFPKPKETPPQGATGPGEVLVIGPDGQHLGTITLDEIPTNVGWGDDGSTLYITAHTSVYRIRLNSKGLVYSDD